MTHNYRPSHNPRIFIISPTESYLTKRGNRHPLFAELFHNNQYEVTYLSTDYYHAELRRFSKNEKNSCKHNLLYKCIFFTALAYRSNTSVLRLLNSVFVSACMLFYLLWKMRSGDILLLPSRPLEFLLIPKLLKFFRDITTVIDVRDVWPEGLPLGTKIKDRLFASYCNLLNRIAGNSGDLYFYTATGFTDWLDRWAPTKSKFFIPLGFDKDRWLETEPIARVSEDVIKFVFVGELAQSMSLEPLMEAISNRHNFDLTIIGSGDKEEATRNFVSNLGAKNIHFWGRIQKQQVVESMGSFHISIIPMKLKYAMPNKMFDAIASYRPLLVLGENDASRFVEANDIGWVLPFDKLSIDAFFNKLTVNEVIQKSLKIGEIRSKYAMQSLYKNALKEIITAAKRSSSN